MNNPLKYTDPSGFDFAGSGCGDDGEGNESEDDDGDDTSSSNSSTSNDNNSGSERSWGERLSDFFDGLFGGSKPKDQSTNNTDISAAIAEKYGMSLDDLASIGGVVAFYHAPAPKTPNDAIAGFLDSSDGDGDSDSGVNLGTITVTAKLGELETDNNTFSKIYDGLKNAIPKALNGAQKGFNDMLHNAPLYAKAPLYAATSITVAPVVEVLAVDVVTYAINNPVKTIVTVEVLNDVLNPSMPATTPIGMMYNMYDNFDELKSFIEHKVSK